MRSSTRTADRVRLSVLALGLSLAACTSATGAVAVTGDHSTDAGENHRARAFVADDHSLDRVEAMKAGASR